MSETFVFQPRPSESPGTVVKPADRIDIPLGPVFSERAETVGRGNWSVALNYLYADYKAIDGVDLDALVNAPNTLGFRDEATDFFEPVAVAVDLDLEAQILAMSATYGVTSELDVNVFVPVVRTALRARTTLIAPDPRVPPDPSYIVVASDALAPLCQ